jgi:hypothetical protein
MGEIQYVLSQNVAERTRDAGVAEREGDLAAAAGEVQDPVGRNGNARGFGVTFPIIRSESVVVAAAARRPQRRPRLHRRAEHLAHAGLVRMSGRRARVAIVPGRAVDVRRVRVANAGGAARRGRTPRRHEHDDDDERTTTPARGEK